MEQGHKYWSDAVHKSRDKAAQKQQGIKVSVSHIDSLSIPATQTHIKNALSEWTLEMLASEDLIYMDTEPNWCLFISNGLSGTYKVVVTYFVSQNNIDKNCLKDWFNVDGVDGSGIKYFNSGYNGLMEVWSMFACSADMDILTEFIINTQHRHLTAVRNDWVTQKVGLTVAESDPIRDIDNATTRM
ncbi:hypothetical protein BC830DRAFT_1222702 [Chytriomyces sp. MP71]|nr:hypothetical protein BC830DRAFT_1222702 [Chytriomyces sp. MP71]